MTQTDYTPQLLIGTGVKASFIRPLRLYMTKHLTPYQVTVVYEAGMFTVGITVKGVESKYAFIRWGCRRVHVGVDGRTVKREVC